MTMEITAHPFFDEVLVECLPNDVAIMPDQWLVAQIAMIRCGELLESHDLDIHELNSEMKAKVEHYSRVIQAAMWCYCLQARGIEPTSGLRFWY